MGNTGQGEQNMWKCLKVD